MNTIKIYLSVSGRIANLLKDFPLYKGQFNDKLLNVYVPTSILAPQFDIQHYIGQNTVSTLPDDSELASFVADNTYPSREPETGDIVEIYNETTQKYYVYVYGTDSWTHTEVTSFGTFNNIAGTSVKIGMIATKPNGVMYQSKSYFMRYLKTLTYQNVEYALYERKLPKEFTSFVGQGQNAPTLIANVVNVDTEDSSVTSLITSQSCKLDVMESTMLDQDETIEAGDLETFEAELDVLSAKVDLKQDKIDQTLNTTSKSVVGAINGLASSTSQNASDIHDNAQAISEIQGEQITQNEKISTNEDNIATNAGNISDLQERVSTLEQTSITGETYIGTMTGSSLPTSTQLTNYVVATAGRQPKGGDYVYFTLIVSGGTDKNYKYAYSSVSGWDDGAEIPAMEVADNSTYGIVKGTYGDSTKNTQVNIDGGEILSVHVKDGTNTMRDVREYLNTTASTLANTNTQVNTNTGDISTQGGKISTLEGQMSNILDGTTAVAKATSATNDGLNRNIAQTYMTQSAGATKQDIKNYALPRAFNDVSFIAGSNVMSDTIPQGVNPIYTVTSSAVGETQLFYVEKEIGDVEYQLASKNSYSDTIYVTASADCDVQFGVATLIYDSTTQQWNNVNIELTDVISMTANEIKKVSMGSTLNFLNDVITVKEHDIIKQIFGVYTSVSTSITFNVYSNEVYPSTFYLNTTSQVITTQAGELGQIPVYSAEGTYDSGTNTISFAIPSIIETLHENTYCLFKLNYTSAIASGTKIKLTYSNDSIRIITPPYNKSSSADATIDDLQSFYTNGVGLEIEGLIQSVSGDLVVYATVGGGGGSSQSITINSTPGSESISDGTDTLDVVTRDTTQVISGAKTFTKTLSVNIQTSTQEDSSQELLQIGGGIDGMGVASEVVSGGEINDSQGFVGLQYGCPTISFEQTIKDENTQEEISSVSHSIIITNNGVEIDNEVVPTTYQKKTDNSLTTTNKTVVGAINELNTGVSDIDTLIPAQASLSNQLADKNFVNSSVATNTANFLGTFETLSDLSTYIDTHTATVTNNDYAFVTNSLIEYNGGDFPDKATMDSYVATNILDYTNYDYAWVVNGTKFDLYYLDILTDPEEMVLKASNVNKSDITIETFYNRYKYNKTANTINFEYTLNNTQFTASQWASINSGITSADVTQIGTNTTNIGTLSSNKADKSATVSNVGYVSASKKIQQTINGTTTDVVTLGDNAFSNTPIPVYTEESKTIASNSWHALVAQSDVYKYTATVNITHTIGADTEVGIAVDNVLQFAEYGFVIGLVAGQNIDVYSAKQPTNSVTLTFTFKD